MPEFIMPLGSRAAAAEDYERLPQFVQGYIEALFFTGDEEMGEATFEDLAPETLKNIVADYHAFTKAAAPLLGQAFERGYQHDQAGRDFWLTRNGHGVGFWDRDVLDAGGLGNALSNCCGFGTDFPGVDAYRGDDGKVYLS